MIYVKLEIILSYETFYVWVEYQTMRGFENSQSDLFDDVITLLSMEGNSEFNAGEIEDPESQINVLSVSDVCPIGEKILSL